MGPAWSPLGEYATEHSEMSTDSPLYLSFPVGTWWSTRVRISVFFPLIVVVLMLRMDDLQLGLLVSGLLFVSVLLHEFGHVFAARLTGGYGDEILIWPLGGLASVHHGVTFSSRFLTPAAGPTVNLLLCGVVLIPVVATEQFLTAVNPWAMGTLDLDGASWLERTCLMMFVVNWMLVLLNLLPIHPFDGGRMLQAGLAVRLGNEFSALVYLRIGTVAGIIVLILGLMCDSSGTVALGAFILLMNLQESAQLRAGGEYEENFMGYDFSQGYTSLERSSDDVPPHARPGILQRWKQKRRNEKDRRSQAQVARDEEEMDRILQKLHDGGVFSLTEPEKRILNRESKRLRDREKDDG